MTLNEAATILGVQADTLRRQVRLGKLMARKVGRDWHVTPKEVDRYQRENRRG
jgi:excisionase family DNA binding protein